MNAFTQPSTLTLDAVSYRLIESLREALCTPDGGAPHAVYQKGLKLCAHLLAHYAAPAAKAPAKVALAPWQERKAKELMAQGMATPLSIAEVAQACALSRSHFSRAFKKKYRRVPTGLAVERPGRPSQATPGRQPPAHCSDR